MKYLEYFAAGFFCALGAVTAIAIVCWVVGLLG